VGGFQQPQDGICLYEGKTFNLLIEEQKKLGGKMGIAQGVGRSNNKGNIWNLPKNEELYQKVMHHLVMPPFDFNVAQVPFGFATAFRTHNNDE